MTRRVGMRGVSLIELMVALAIGILLLLGVIEVFSASRVAYQLSTGLARTQENGRFALDILQRDIRMAGHNGCVNDQARFLPENVTPSRPALLSTFLTADQQAAGEFAPAGLHPALRFDTAIQGFEARDTETGELTLPATLTPAADASGWEPAIPSGLFDAMQSPLSGSDILVLRNFTPTGAQISNFVAGDPATITFNTSHTPRLLEGVAQPRLFGIADCMGAAVFKGNYANLADGTVTVSSGNGNQVSLESLPVARGQAMLYRADSLIYYVGLNAQGIPALFRTRFGMNAAGVVQSLNEELVEGIELMQLRFGQDSFTAAGTRPSGNIGSATTADALAGASPEEAWRRVGVVQVGLIARSAESAAAGPRVESAANPPLSTLGLTIVPPQDRFYRSVYEDSIALRNRLFGN